MMLLALWGRLALPTSFSLPSRRLPPPPDAAAKAWGKNALIDAGIMFHFIVLVVGANIVCSHHRGGKYLQ